MQDQPAERPFRVAILGLGPKGLFALERLLDGLCAERQGLALAIEVFEPHPALGAGAIYDPAQPDFLRMNLAADGVDLWRLPNHALATDRQPSFVEWRRRGGIGSTDEDFPPRSQVGRYLADCCEQLLAAVPPGSSLRLHPAPAHRINASGGCWRVESAEFTGTFEEVLLSAGHQESWRGSLRNGWRHAARLVPGVYPVDRMLSAVAVPPGATVAVRGFGLTFLDAALGLTEGRAGNFRRVENSTWRLTYVPAGSEPAAILPFSRTGETMLAKADRSIVNSIGALDEIARAGNRGVHDLTSATDRVGELLSIIAATARALLRETRDEVDAERLSRQAEEWLAAPDQQATPRSHDAARELEHSLRVAAGEVPPGLEWALAQSWLLLLGAIVERMGGEALDERGWVRFRSLARKMERIAFGPPAINAAKLLALIEAGIVDLGQLAGGRIADRGQATELVGAEAGRSTVDVVVDAVMPEPGVRGSHAGVLHDLLDDGRVRVRDGRRGLDIAEDGSCLDRAGSPNLGLSAIGRPTEDSVIDNDTLSRTIHRHSELWARRVLARAKAFRKETPEPTT